MSDFLNEAEKLLVRQWQQAWTLEQSMGTVRTKYAQLLSKAAEGVAQSNPAFDVVKTFFTQFWESGYAAFSCKKWPDSKFHYPPGIYLEQLRLEKLASEREPQPAVSVFIGARVLGMLKAPAVEVARRLNAGARSVFSEEDYARFIVSAELDDPLINFASPTKKELLDLLISGDEELFTQSVISYLEPPMRMIAILDEILADKK